MGNEDSQKFLKYKTKILAVNTGDQPDRLTHDIVVPTFRGYAPGDRIPAGTLLSAIIEKEFNSTPPTPKVTITVVGNGTTSPAAGTHNVTYGGDFTFNSAIPATGYRLKDIIVDGEAKTAPFTIRNITADKTIAVTFEEITPTPTYTITATAGANGSVSPTGAQTVGEHGNITFTATPASGYVVDAWKLDGATQSEIGTSFTVSNVTADHTVEVTFKTAPVTSHTITVTAGANGTISPAGPVTVSDGADQVFTITANSGYEIEDVKADGVSVGAVPDYTFTNVTADHTISATFKVIPVVVDTYTVNVTNNTPTFGTITPASGTVNVGTTTTVTATPNSGYKIKTLTLDGVDKTSPFTIDGVKDQTYNVVVEFEKIPSGKLYTLLTGVKPAATDITDEFAEEEFDDTVDSQDFHIHGGTTLGTKVSIAYPASKGDLVSVTFDAWAGGIPDGGYLAKCTVTDVTKDGVAYKFLTTGSLSKNADVRLTLS